VISLDRALKAVLARARRGRLATERVTLLESEGRVLAERVTSDVDLPPFHRVAMDGFAVRSRDVVEAPVLLTVVGTVLAGQVGSRRLLPGEAIRIMTGAPLPAGADAVVMVERTEETDGGKRVLVRESVTRFGNVARKGEDLRKGRTVLRPGRCLGAVEAGMLATVGRERALVSRRPEVTLLVTGDELVEPRRRPGPGKIRNSNAYSVGALVQGVGGRLRFSGIVKDHPPDLRREIKRGLRSDVLLLTGGVSMGQADFVPGLLREKGVCAHFHRVALKPGKPLFFGSTPGCLVFGLPGNPVSSLVDFLLFVRPALLALQGTKARPPWTGQARLAGDAGGSSRLTVLVPVEIGIEEGGLVARPVPYHGSGDFTALLRADGFALLAPGEECSSGAQVKVMPLPGRAPHVFGQVARDTR